MNKKITIVGTILLITGLVLVVLGNMDILSLSTYKQDYSPNEISPTETSVNNQLQTKIFTSEETTQGVKPYYSAIKAFILIFPTDNNGQFFSISIGIKFLEQNTICPLENDVCIFQDTTKEYSEDSIFQADFVVTEASLMALPFFMPGINVDPSIEREYYLIIESDAGFGVQYVVESRWRITVPLGLILGIIGLIITVVGFVKSSGYGKYRPIPTQPAFEPSIGGGSRGSEKSSKKSRKPKKDKSMAKSSQRGGAFNCKKCNGVMPKNAQYCPHCYTRQ